MADKINKVLLIAYLESSREPVYEMSNQFKEAGYSLHVAYAKPEEEEGEKTPLTESHITPDVYMTKHMDLDMYKGVVFIDDGGDSGIAKVLAKRANEATIPLGGYGYGCQVLHEAKALKDKYIAIGLPKEFSKGNDVVNSPAVRAENIVTSAGNCPTGFAFLMMDAMGGEVKKMVEANDEVPVQPVLRAALLVTKMQRWADHWDLAEQLSQQNATLLIADWQDLDIATHSVQRFLAVGPHIKNKVALYNARCEIPKTVWMKGSSVKTADMKEAASILKSIGATSNYAVDEEYEQKLRSVERELNLNGIWMQPSGQLAIQENDKTEFRTPENAIWMLKADVNYYLEKFKEAEQEQDRRTRMFARLVGRSVFRLRLVYELIHLRKQLKIAVSKPNIKTADYAFENFSGEGDYAYGKGSVPGPYSNIRMPSRVIPWHQGEDWLEDINGIDEETMQHLERYFNPKWGEVETFDLWHRNEPVPWDKLDEEGIYPMRSQLMH